MYHSSVSALKEAAARYDEASASALADIEAARSAAEADVSRISDLDTILSYIAGSGPVGSTAGDDTDTDANGKSKSGKVSKSSKSSKSGKGSKGKGSKGSDNDDEEASGGNNSEAVASHPGVVVAAVEAASSVLHSLANLIADATRPAGGAGPDGDNDEPPAKRQRRGSRSSASREGRASSGSSLGGAAVAAAKAVAPWAKAKHTEYRKAVQRVLRESQVRGGRGAGSSGAGGASGGDDDGLAEFLLHCLLADLKWVGELGQSPFSVSAAGSGASSGSVSGFPNELLYQVVAAVLDSQHAPLCETFATTYANEYRDVQVFTLRNIVTYVGKLEGKTVGPSRDGRLGAALRLVLAMSVVERSAVGDFVELESGGGDDDDDDAESSTRGSESGRKDGAGAKRASAKRKRTKAKNKKRKGEFRAAFTEAALAVLNCPNLPADLFRLALAKLHSNILPHFTQPIQLLSFLSLSFDVGGVTGMLSLNGLFVLITQHNLDYPEFFPRLYAMLEPRLFYEAHAFQFFSLLDTFLSSRYLPSYLVAAFVKRLARLALAAPAPIAVVVLAIIHNVMIRHPQTTVLVHRPPAAAPSPFEAALIARDREESASKLAGAVSTETTTSSASSGAYSGKDPFLVEEDDPTACNAADSSLWELEALKQHSCPNVVRAAKVFDNPLSQSKIDVSTVNKTYNDMITVELKRRSKNTATAAVPAQSLFSVADAFDPRVWSTSAAAATPAAVAGSSD